MKVMISKDRPVVGIRTERAVSLIEDEMTTTRRMLTFNVLSVNLGLIAVRDRPILVDQLGDGVSIGAVSISNLEAVRAFFLENFGRLSVI